MVHKFFRSVEKEEKRLAKLINRKVPLPTERLVKKPKKVITKEIHIKGLRVKLTDPLLKNTQKVFTDELKKEHPALQAEQILYYKGSKKKAGRKTVIKALYQ